MVSCWKCLRTGFAAALGAWFLFASVVTLRGWQSPPAAAESIAGSIPGPELEATVNGLKEQAEKIQKQQNLFNKHDSNSSGNVERFDELKKADNPAQLAAGRQGGAPRGQIEEPEVPAEAPAGETVQICRGTLKEGPSSGRSCSEYWLNVARKQVVRRSEHRSRSCRRGCHSAAPPSPFSMRINRDDEGVPAT